MVMTVKSIFSKANEKKLPVAKMMTDKTATRRRWSSISGHASLSSDARNAMTLVVLMRYGVCTVQIRNECGSYRWDIASEEGSFDGLEQTKEGARSMNPFLRLNRVSVRKSSRSPMQNSNANEQTAQRERALLSPPLISQHHDVGEWQCKSRVSGRSWLASKPGRQAWYRLKGL